MCFGETSICREIALKIKDFPKSLLTRSSGRLSLMKTLNRKETSRRFQESIKINISPQRISNRNQPGHVLPNIMSEMRTLAKASFKMR